MFRCDNCGSGYSIRAASSWECCPRCLARERVTVPLTFELGWRGGGQTEPPVLKRLPLEPSVNPVEVSPAPGADAAA
jgi:hypothetical protein